MTDTLESPERNPPFFRDITCENAEEFFDAISISGSNSEFYRRESWYFRGLSCESYDLLPTAFRPSFLKLATDVILLGQHGLANADPNNLSTQEQVLIEATLLLCFMQSCNDAALQIPGFSAQSYQSLRRLVESIEVHASNNFDLPVANRDPLYPSRRADIVWPDEDWMACLAFARHSALPTRLVDWTSNPLVAAYFASLPSAKKKRCLSSVEPDCCDKAVDDTHRMVVWAISELAILLVPTEPPFVIRGERGELEPTAMQISNPPVHGNRHMYAQQGVFTMSRVMAMEAPTYADSRPVNEILMDNLSKHQANYADPLLMRITVPTKWSEAIIHTCSKYNIREARLFPSYDGAVRDAMQFGLRR